MKKRIVDILLVAACVLGLGGLGVAVVVNMLAPQPVDSKVETAVSQTMICGLFHAPTVVVGVPVATTSDTVTFADGYVLRLTRVPSMYLDRWAAFAIQDGNLIAYGLTVPNASPCVQQ
jgi:hypothetical protein